VEIGTNIAYLKSFDYPSCLNSNQVKVLFVC